MCVPSLSRGAVGCPFGTSHLPPLSAVSCGEKGNPNPSRRSRGMALADENPEASGGSNVWNLCRMPFWQAGGSGSSSLSAAAGVSHHHVSHGHAPRSAEGSDTQYSGASGSVSSVAKSLLLTRRRLRLDPASKLYFPYEPGKQVRSAIKIKNTSKSHVAFKFQTTSPKSCFMRPPGAILSPGENIIATVFKFVEHPENNEKVLDQKNKVKFKIVSLKVKGPMEYVPELLFLPLNKTRDDIPTDGHIMSKQFDEQKDQVAVEQILSVVFLDVERPSPRLDKLKRQLAEADAAVEAHKKLPEETGPRILGEGLVIDEWKERRERYLAQQQVELVDSV
ncbi:MSP (Major sperm protein) domain [Musa troglodytarum]|uniref:MSP (Major sperm protein) domain n=1 Tax=Musa troglodytarum TaxID=320322 RepID=A0A9E7FM31_9LILI|nr:MSP (Major sperm protein) domain [Musa troglodytarum]